MKALLQLTWSALLMLALWSQAQAQCGNDNDQFGSSTVTCGMSPLILTSCIYGGEYRVVTGIVAGNTYVFSTCGDTDFDTQITLYNEAGGPFLAYNDDFCGAQSQVTWVATFSGAVRVLVDQFNCQSNSTCMTLTASCTAGAPPPVVGCNNTTSFGSATINTSGTSVQISSCSFAGEYSTISGAVAGQTLQFTYSLSGGYITVRSSSPGGPVVAQGASPLSFNNTHTGTLYAHWNTSAACGSNSTCSVTTVQCTSCAPPSGPANDACANATPISCGGTVSGSTASATTDGPGSSCTGGSVAPDVWYTITGTGGDITASLCGSGYDTKLDVYTGSCGALTNIGGCNDDFCSFQSQMTWTATNGVVYRIRVHGFSGSTGSFTLAVTCAAPPAPPCNAPGTPTASNVSSTSATLSWAAAPGATLYRYSSGTGAHTCGTGSLTTSGTSVSLSGLSPNTTYTFCVRTDACGGGSASNYVSTTFTTAPLANDLCSGAPTVTCGSTINGSTVGASSDAALGSCGVGTGGTPNNGVWYKLEGNGAQVTASLCASGYDTKVHVYAGSCSGLSCVASNDDFCSTRSQVVFNASVGVDYYILVSGFGSSTGAFSMSLSCECGPNLDAPWTVSNLGGAVGPAIDNVCDGTIDLSSNGIGGPTSDKLKFAWQNLCGNGSIVAKVENVTNGGWAGLMFRESSATGSRRVSLRTQLSTLVVRDLRATTNGFMNSQQIARPLTPQWLRIDRTGNTFVGYTSVDGNNWDQAFVANVAMPSCAQVGLFTQGINVNSVAQASFSNVGIGSISPLVAAPPSLAVDPAGAMGLNLYPNPASDVLNVQLDSYLGQAIQLEVFNSLGQRVRSLRFDEVTEATTTLNLSDLTNGVYHLSVQADGQERVSRKFVIAGPRP